MNHTIPHVFRTTQLPGTCPRECVCVCVCVCVWWWWGGIYRCLGPWTQTKALLQVCSVDSSYR